MTTIQYKYYLTRIESMDPNKVYVCELFEPKTGDNYYHSEHGWMTIEKRGFENVNGHMEPFSILKHLDGKILSYSLSSGYVSESRFYDKNIGNNHHLKIVGEMKEDEIRKYNIGDYIHQKPMFTEETFDMMKIEKIKIINKN